MRTSEDARGAAGWNGPPSGPCLDFGTCRAEGGPAPKPHRVRHDGFTPAKQRKFFKALKKTGCLSDSARVAGVSRTTVRRHRNKWPAFAARVERALAFASEGLEAIAWQRATIGAEEKIYRNGELIMVRVKPSDAILRLLLQGAHPKKYGRPGPMPKGEALKRLKAEARQEVMATMRADEEELNEAIIKHLDVLSRREAMKRRRGERAGSPEEGRG
jgi:hypothetical protein